MQMTDHKIVMLNRKPLFAKTPERLPQGQLPFDSDDEQQHKPSRKIEVTALDIDQGHGQDCDPYNSTGQFATVDAKNNV